MGRLLQEARARQREAEAALQKAKEKSRETDEEILRLTKTAVKQKISMEHQEER